MSSPAAAQRQCPGGAGEASRQQGGTTASGCTVLRTPSGHPGVAAVQRPLRQLVVLGSQYMQSVHAGPPECNESL